MHAKGMASCRLRGWTWIVIGIRRIMELLELWFAEYKATRLVYAVPVLFLLLSLTLVSKEEGKQTYGTLVCKVCK